MRGVTTMNLRLPLNGISNLSQDYLAEIDQFVDEIIQKHKSNTNVINTLVLDSVACLSVAEARSNELASQGKIKKIWNGLKGKNKKIRAEIDRNLVSAQYASQQMIQKLAEQNLLTFELITTVNNKLNTMITEVEEEINRIYELLLEFFKQVRSNMVQLESRVEKLEQNVNLLHWHNTIEYQMFDGVEYFDLPEIEKIICLADDFYHLTKGKWSTADLMLLKSTMAEIGMNVKKEITYKEFFEYIISKPKLLDKLLGGLSIETAINIEPYQASLIKGIEKYYLLQTEESYIVDAVASISNVIDYESIRLSLVYNYLKTQAIFDMNKSVNVFEFMNELLLNLSIFFNPSPTEVAIYDEYEKKISELEKVVENQQKEITKYKELIGKIIREEWFFVRASYFPGWFIPTVKSVLLLKSDDDLVEKKHAQPFIEWKVSDRDLVKKGDILGWIKSSTSSSRVFSINSPKDGRLHIIKKSGEVEKGEIIAVITTPVDEIRDMDEWLKWFQ
jgi:hypothetical protein